MSERELFDEISRLNGIFFSNTDPAHYEKDCYLMFLEGLKSAESELAELRAEHEAVRDALDGYNEDGISAAELVKTMRHRHDSYVESICDLKAENEALQKRVAELEGLVRDIKQADIDETAKRISDGGRKFNYSLSLKIRERIASALKEPANEG